MHTKANKNILLTIGVVVVVGICVGLNFEKFYNKRIVDEHLSEVNACIKRHIDEVNPKKKIVRMVFCFCIKIRGIK